MASFGGFGLDRILFRFNCLPDGKPCPFCQFGPSRLLRPRGGFSLILQRLQPKFHLDGGDAGFSGFTLIELLVVVGIISILSAIAVPNFLEAQTRAKVSRVKADMRSMATALESYAVDNNHYPPRTRTPTGLTRLKMGDVSLRVQETKRITTPISYMTKLPEDVFENTLAPPLNIIDYWGEEVMKHAETFGAAGDPDIVRQFGQWYLVSVGPDGVVGAVGNAGGFPDGAPLDGLDSGILQDPHLAVEYDPTNGTISRGNVSRSQIDKTLTEINMDRNPVGWGPRQNF